MLSRFLVKVMLVMFLSFVLCSRIFFFVCKFGVKLWNPVSVVFILFYIANFTTNIVVVCCKIIEFCILWCDVLNYVAKVYNMLSKNK